MSIQKYLENQEEIKRLREENENILKDIQEEAILKCPFKLDDVIKGKEIGDKIRAVKIRRITALIADDGNISYVAFGFPMNLNGSFSSNNYNERKIYIDEQTSKIM